MERIKNSLFVKLALLLITVIIIPSVVSNVIGYWHNYEMVHQQIIDWNNNMMEIGMNQTLSYLSGIRQAPQQLFENADVIRILEKQNAYTDMDRYVLRNFEETVSESLADIYRVDMECKNGETVSNVLADAEKRIEISRYLYPEKSDEEYQIAVDENGSPAAFIYNIDIENIPSYEKLVNIRIFSTLEELESMAKTLCGQYEDSAVFVYLGQEEPDQMIFSSEAAESVIFQKGGEFENGYEEGEFNGCKGMFFCQSEVYGGLTVHLVKFIDNHYFVDSSNRVIASAFIIQILLLAVSVVFLFFAFNIFISPVRRMLNNMKSVEETRDFEYKSGTDRKDELGVLEKQYEGLIESLDELVNKNYRSQLESTKYRLKMLQAQINPHFLFNILQYISTNALKSHCPEVSAQLIKLGRLYQYVMHTEDLVPIERELGYIEDYVALQGGRFNGRLRFSIRCDEELKGVEIPKMILQPLVENSMKHGIDKNNGNGNIMISIMKQEEECRIRVMDNGAGMNREQIRSLQEAYENYEFTSYSGHGIGLLNVLWRCKISYGSKFRWDIRSIPKVETAVELTFLLKEQEEI